MKSTLSLLSLSLSTLPLAHAGTTLWSGLFNETFTVENFDKWSWSSQIPPYQWYIHGTESTSHYLSLSDTFKNPNSTLVGDEQGLKTTLDNTSSWNGQSMMRTELIPQVESGAGVDIGSGKLYYHFSLAVNEEGFPNEDIEHQVAFFESHFTELKYGGSSDVSSNLTWYANSAAQWGTELVAGEWYNFAYGIDFDNGGVELYASTGAEELELVVDAVEASAQSNGQDWHVGVLRLDNGVDGGEEAWYWGGVYVEEGDVSLEV
ncbi:glycoside hydrolase family 131 protein [Aspergillus mulundensis]|uniref:Glycoside hydrolase 131 catalytic N-terminal domain-containing protein n=1 Tax=Aspergillus mulundensis TaxID=1810919 RepID=A0A3D8RL27_9EURO|nr:Uncharacterized protein DSM5745_07183 [Aspergillus mulundensis]RDW74521.1 Uncharacterized protein DSM5745_07183 [Aspergillus mulundensis]